MFPSVPLGIPDPQASLKRGRTRPIISAHLQFNEPTPNNCVRISFWGPPVCVLSVAEVGAAADAKAQEAAAECAGHSSRPGTLGACFFDRMPLSSAPFPKFPF